MPAAQLAEPLYADVRSAQHDMIVFAGQRLAVVLNPEVSTTLDAVMRRLFNRGNGDLVTYSAFGSAL